MNICEAGHKKHERRIVETQVEGQPFKFEVYDWEKYKDVIGYCTGKDDISRTLINEGYWEKEETPLVLDVLKRGSRENIVLDFGAHIGWYTILAASLGYNVEAFEGDRENAYLTLINHNHNNIETEIKVHPMWIDETTPVQDLMPDKEVQLLKSDLEGKDHEVVRVCEKMFEQRKIHYALIEVSPVLNPEHKDLPDMIKAYGYEVIAITGDLARQANVLFKRL